MCYPNVLRWNAKENCNGFLRHQVNLYLYSSDNNWRDGHQRISQECLLSMIFVSYWTLVNSGRKGVNYKHNDPVRTLSSPARTLIWNVLLRQGDSANLHNIMGKWNKFELFVDCWLTMYKQRYDTSHYRRTRRCPIEVAKNGHAARWP